MRATASARAVVLGVSTVAAATLVLSTLPNSANAFPQRSIRRQLVTSHPFQTSAGTRIFGDSASNISNASEQARQLAEDKKKKKKKKNQKKKKEEEEEIPAEPIADALELDLNRQGTGWEKLDDVAKTEVAKDAGAAAWETMGGVTSEEVRKDAGAAKWEKMEGPAKEEKQNVKPKPVKNKRTTGDDALRTQPGIDLQDARNVGPRPKPEDTKRTTGDDAMRERTTGDDAVREYGRDYYKRPSAACIPRDPPSNYKYNSVFKPGAGPKENIEESRQNGPGGRRLHYHSQPHPTDEYHASGKGKGKGKGDKRKKTIADAVGEAPFDILGKALEITDLLPVFAEPGPFTVFGPTNDAFLALNDINPNVLFCLTAPSFNFLLTDILLYHTVEGAALLSTDLSNNQMIQTIGGPSGSDGEVTVRKRDTGIFIDESKVILPDNNFTNGVVHGIDAVLTEGPFDLSLLNPCLQSPDSFGKGYGKGKGKGKGKGPKAPKAPKSPKGKGKGLGPGHGYGPEYHPGPDGHKPGYKPGPGGSGPGHKPGSGEYGPGYKPGPGGSGPGHKPGSGGYGPGYKPGSGEYGPGYKSGSGEYGPGYKPGSGGNGPGYKPGPGGTYNPSPGGKNTGGGYYDDYDCDGLSNADEKLYGTDIYNADTDNDGLLDGDEIFLGTNPFNPDSDNDDVKDGDEDTDGDGITDAEELTMGLDPTTDDTDGDGILDNEELRLGTDPSDADTDGDGLKDKVELILGTDPKNADSDFDGLTDKEETDLGTDPLDEDSDNDGIIDGDDSHPLDPARGGVAGGVAGGDGGGSSVSGIQAGAQQSTLNAASISGIAVAASLLLLCILFAFFVVGRRRDDDDYESSLALRKNASRDGPYDFGDSITEISSDNENPKKWVSIGGDGSSAGSSIFDLEADDHVHNCKSALCPTCNVDPKDPVFVNLNSDGTTALASMRSLAVGNVVQQELARQRLQDDVSSLGGDATDRPYYTSEGDTIEL